MSNTRCSRRAMMASDVDKMPETLKIDLKNLAKLAYNGLMHGNLVFSYDEIESIIPDDDDDDANIEQHLLGLMTATKSSSSSGREVTYQFLHLTIQEYLAAKWAAVEILPEQQAAFMKTHLSNDRLRMMLLFLAGITQPSSGDLFSSETLSFSDERHRDLRMQRRLLFLCHITYEAQSSCLCHSLTNSIKDKTISLSGHGLTLFDYRVLGYFLANSDCHFKRLTISGNISKQDLVALKQGILIPEGAGSVKVECVDFLAAEFQYNVALSILPTVPLLKDCEVLFLNLSTDGYGSVKNSRVQDFGDEGMPNLFTEMQSLIHFTVQGQVTKRPFVGISAPRYQADETFTALNEIPTLRILELEQVQVNISEDTCSRITGMMSRLTALRVIQCNGFDTLMNCVAQSLTCTTSLVELEMSDNCIFSTSDEKYVNLFRAIKKNGTLKKLDVSKIGYYPRHQKVNKLQRSPSIKSLEHIRQIQRQPVGMELLEAVYEMLSCNNTLEELLLFEWNLIGPSPVPQFQRRTTPVSRFQIHIKSSSKQQQELNPEKLEPMAKGLLCNHTLLKLGIESCSIEPLKLQVAQLKQTSPNKHPGPNPNLHYTDNR